VVAVPVHDGLFVGGAEPHLIGATCRTCGREHFPTTSTCPYCGSRDVEAGPLPTVGRLWAWTAVTAAPPGYGGPVPYGFGVVELGDSLRLVTRITEPDVAALRVGQEMHLVLDEVGERDGQAVVSWAFAPS
jgi:uncharacterized OB-fold protein